MNDSFVTESPDELFYMAENDIISVKELSAGSFYPADRKYNVICFLATQAVEKFLKGYIINNKKKIEKTHSLDLLHQAAIKIEASFANIREHAIFLNTFIPNIRYSSSKQITKAEMARIIASMEVIGGFPPIKTMRDSFSKKHKYEIVGEITTGS
jgi:HEPN domain-containing protein